MNSATPDPRPPEPPGGPRFAEARFRLANALRLRLIIGVDVNKAVATNFRIIPLTLSDGKVRGLYNCSRRRCCLWSPNSARGRNKTKRTRLIC